MKCRQCTDYKSHDREFGFCKKYLLQRKWNDKCLDNEEWFNEEFKNKMGNSDSY